MDAIRPGGTPTVQMNTALPLASTEPTRSYGPFRTTDRPRGETFGLVGARENTIDRAHGASYSVEARLSSPLDADPSALRVVFFGSGGAKLGVTPMPGNGRLSIPPDLHPGAVSFGLEVPEGHQAVYRVDEAGGSGQRALPPIDVKARPAAQYDSPIDKFRATASGVIELDRTSRVEFSGLAQPKGVDGPAGYGALRVSIWDPVTKKELDRVPLGADGRLVVDGSKYPNGAVVGLESPHDLFGARVRAVIAESGQERRREGADVFGGLDSGQRESPRHARPPTHALNLPTLQVSKAEPSPGWTPANDAEFRSRLAGVMPLPGGSTLEYAASAHPRDRSTGAELPFEVLRAQLFDPRTGRVVDDLPFGRNGRLLIDSSAYPPGVLVGVATRAHALASVQSRLAWSEPVQVPDPSLATEVLTRRHTPMR